MVEEPHHNTYDIEFWGADGMCTSFVLQIASGADHVRKVDHAQVGIIPSTPEVNLTVRRAAHSQCGCLLRLQGDRLVQHDPGSGDRGCISAAQIILPHIKMGVDTLPELIGDVQHVPVPREFYAIHLVMSGEVDDMLHRAKRRVEREERQDGFGLHGIEEVMAGHREPFAVLRRD